MNPPVHQKYSLIIFFQLAFVAIIVAFFLLITSIIGHARCDDIKMGIFPRQTSVDFNFYNGISKDKRERCKMPAFTCPWDDVKLNKDR